MKEQIFELTTSGGVEGRSTKTVGFFKGTLNQIITFCLNQDIKPFYYFDANPVNVVDVTKISPIVSVTSGKFGRLSYVTPSEREKELKKIKALNKLTDEDKEILGVN